MAKSYTPNYNFEKDDLDEFYDVMVQSDNMDLVDLTIKGLDDRIVDIETEAVTPFTTSASIQSLPVGTLEGKASDFSAEGLTLVNSVVNGDFSDGTTGWTPGGSNIAVNNKIMSVTGSGGSNAVAMTQPAKLLALGSKEFYKVRFRVTNANCTKLRMRLYSGTLDVEVANIVMNTWYTVSGIITGTPSTASILMQPISIEAFYADAATANGKVMEVDGNAGVHGINLTALGLTDLTEAQLLDLVRSGYIDGIQGVVRPQVESVGKNLFDVYKIPRTIQNATAVMTEREGKECLKLNMANLNGIITGFKPNTQYTISADVQTESLIAPSGLMNIDFEDGTSQYFHDLSLSWKSISLTTPIGKSVKQIGVSFFDSGNPIYYADIQFEEGTLATAYETHQSSHLTADTTLHRLPNGMKDRQYEADGQVWKEKQVQEYTLVSGDITSLLTTYTNVDVVGVKKPLDYKSYGIGGLTAVTDAIISSFVGKAFADSVSATGGVMQDSSSSLGLMIPKGTYATLVAAQAALAGTKIIYQRATPQLINLTEQGLVDGELMSFENGTVYNSSDTFHAQNVHFDVPTNRGAQIESLLDSANAQAKAIESKASKVQEDWIEPTLLNGWVNFGAPLARISYMKDEMGFVHMKGSVKNGTTADLTTFLYLPTGYRPANNIYFGVVSGLGAHSALGCNTDGNVFAQGNISTNVLVAFDGISFKAEA